MNEIISAIFNLNTFSAALRLATPIALAAMGGAFSERAGVINIGLEGMILIGAFSAAFASFFSGSAWIGVLAAILAGGLLGLLLALFTIKLKADHVVAGVGLNIFALGLTSWLMQVVWGSKGSSSSVRALKEISIPILRDIPILGRILGKQSPLVYIMLFLIILGWYLLFKTPLGLRIRMTGEHPEAADTLGIKVNKIKYFAVVLSGMLSGLGGAYLSISNLNFFSNNMSAGRGYMALAANIFGQWNPLGGFAASLLFSFTDAIQMRLQVLNLNIANELIQLLPYLLTVIILAGAVMKSRPPAALGKHYEPGDK
ncbi:MAG: ABC transporter permease [Bacillota bacterium]